MNEKTLSFVSLIDSALRIAKTRIALRESGSPDPAPPGALENIVDALNRFRKKALEESLPSSEGVVTTGILREVVDWSEPDDSELLRAARDIERYYLETM